MGQYTGRQKATEVRCLLKGLVRRNVMEGAEDNARLIVEQNLWRLLQFRARLKRCSHTASACKAPGRRRCTRLSHHGCKLSLGCCIQHLNWYMSETKCHRHQLLRQLPNCEITRNAGKRPKPRGSKSLSRPPLAMLLQHLDLCCQCCPPLLGSNK